MTTNLITRLKAYDDAREGLPGEHWVVLGAGLGLWYLSSKQPSFIVRLLGMAAATALVGRAASGRDGVVNLLRYTPVGGTMRRGSQQASANVPTLGRAGRAGDQVDR